MIAVRGSCHGGMAAPSLSSPGMQERMKSRAGGWCVRVARGAELGVVVACCQDESGCCVLVQKPIFLSNDSQHCSRWSMAAHPHHEFWQLHEVIPCVAWKVEGGEITAIMM